MLPLYQNFYTWSQIFLWTSWCPPPPKKKKISSHICRILFSYKNNAVEIVQMPADIWLKNNIYLWLKRYNIGIKISGQVVPFYSSTLSLSPGHFSRHFPSRFSPPVCFSSYFRDVLIVKYRRELMFALMEFKYENESFLCKRLHCYYAYLVLRFSDEQIT